jgi:hypothetical protein
MDSNRFTELAIFNLKLLEAAKLLSHVSTPSEGRAALREAGETLRAFKASKDFVNVLGLVPNLSDDQIVPLCHQLTSTWVQQANAMNKAINRVTKKWWQFWK